MLKRKRKTEEVIQDWGERFRDLDQVRSRFTARPAPDEAIIAGADEYRERGKKGYELTEVFSLV